MPPLPTDRCFLDTTSSHMYLVPCGAQQRTAENSVYEGMKAWAGTHYSSSEQSFWTHILPYIFISINMYFLLLFLYEKNTGVNPTKWYFFGNVSVTCRAGEETKSLFTPSFPMLLPSVCAHCSLSHGKVINWTVPQLTKRVCPQTY